MSYCDRFFRRPVSRTEMGAIVLGMTGGAALFMAGAMLSKYELLIPGIVLFLGSMCSPAFSRENQQQLLPVHQPPVPVPQAPLPVQNVNDVDGVRTPLRICR